MSATALKWIRETCDLIFKVNNMISLHQLDMAMLTQFLELFFTLSFSDSGEVCPFIYKTYVNDDMSGIEMDGGYDAD